MHEMKIIFKDFLDDEIAEAQATSLDEYSKVFVMPDGMIKIEEMYSNGNLEYIHYYKETGETEEAAMMKLQNCKVPFSIREREQYYDYMIIKVNSYTGTQLTQKWKFLADAGDFVLCTQAIDIDSGKPLFADTNKYLGKYSNGLEPNYCKFIYDEEGRFAYCDYNYVRDYESGLIEIDGLPVIKERFNLTDELYNYYLTAALLPPLK
jgi:hypothetical protein